MTQILNKGQWLSISVFAALLAILYFGCDTKSKKQQGIEKSRADKIELIDIDRYIRKNKELLPSSVSNDIMNIERSITEASINEEKIEGFKELASLWYSAGYPLSSAFYAEQIAIMENSGQAWSIAATTYSLAVQKSTEDLEKQYAVNKSRDAYDMAIGMDDDNIENKINLALSYVDVQDQENPMKGILMLVDLNKKYPNDPSVLYQLGRLALGTNQIDKAVSRLAQAVEIKKDYTAAYCLLAIAYQKLGDETKAMEAQINCDTNKN
jgi:tetratricopeptide (TPR) repeat protein